MRAIIYTEYGAPDVLQLKEVPTPAPQDNEILVRIRATSINYGDLLARKFGEVTPAEFNMPGPLWLLARVAFGWSKPRVNTLGSEFAGEVAAVGAAVSRFQVGDPVFGYTGQRMGANAEFICVPEDGIVARRPSNLSDAEAAALPYGALTALTLLRHVAITPGRRVLIIGASGGIGAAALQLARHQGAEVTAVCGTQRAALVRELGADHVIDYTCEPLGAQGRTYDVIIDILGRSTFAQCRPLLTPDGRYLRVSFKVRELLQMAWTSRRGGQRVICAFSDEKPADLETIRELAEAGAIRSVIDRCYPLEQTAEAHRYLEAGARRGQVVIQPV